MVSDIEERKSSVCAAGPARGSPPRPWMVVGDEVDDGDEDGGDDGGAVHVIPP